MSLDSYSGLKDELVSWLRRTDITSASPQLDTAIDLFEASAKRDLRAEEMILQTTLTSLANTEKADLPADFKQFSSMRMTSDPRPLNYVSREYLATNYQASQRGRTKSYATGPYNTGTSRQTVQFGPVPDVSYTYDLFYNAVFTGLSDSNTSNWLLGYAPDFYLYGSLMHLLTYVDDPERRKTIQEGYQVAMNSIDEDQARKRAAGASMQPRIQGMTP